MMTIYSLPFSRAIRVQWLMEELGLPYELKKFERNPDFSSQDDLKAIHPLGKSPTIVDGDVVMVESAAILEYIMGKYGDGRFSVGRDSPDYPHYLEWMSLVEGSILPAMMMPASLARSGVSENDPKMQKAVESRERALGYFDSELGKHPYLGGQEFTAADIMAMYVFTIADLMKIDISAYKNMEPYKQKIASRPAYQKAIAR